MNILSKYVEVTGDIKFSDALVIDGRVQGQINSDGVLTVGENATIHGDIHTQSVTVHGTVHGNITVSGFEGQGAPDSIIAPRIRHTRSIPLLHDITMYILHQEIGREDPMDKVPSDIAIVEVVLE